LERPDKACSSLTRLFIHVFSIEIQAGGVEIWQVNEEATVDINGVFYGNLARDLYGHCGSRGGAIAIRWIHGQVTVDGVFLNNRACVNRQFSALFPD
jgi:hypothetical protein